MKEMEYKPLTLPTVSWDTSKSTDRSGTLLVEPLEPGFGITLGNALRRTLLAAVEGSAVTSIIIKGANNEFASIEGVIEDVVHIVLNIKGLIIKNRTGRAGTMKMHVTGAAVATAADIVADEHLDIINKEHIIANVASKGELDITFFVENGRGYQQAQWPESESLQKDDRIYIDARFSPIERIEYHVGKTRVGEFMDYDKLTIGVHTNGAVTPQDVVHYATSVLRTQFEHFLTVAEIPFNAISDVEDTQVATHSNTDEKSPTKGLPVEFFLKPIEELEFSVRAHNCLKNAGINRVIDLVNLPIEEALKIKNFGRKSLREVEEILKAFGLSLGMNIKEIDLKRMIKEQEDGL